MVHLRGGGDFVIKGEVHAVNKEASIMIEFQSEYGICFIDPDQVIALDSVSWPLYSRQTEEHGVKILLAGGQNMIVYGSIKEVSRRVLESRRDQT